MSQNTNSLEPFIYRFVLPVALFVGFCMLIDALSPMLPPFIVGALIAYLFDPLADRLERAGCSRTAATLIIMINVFTILTLLIVLLGPILGAQAVELAKSLPEMLSAAKNWLTSHGDEWMELWRANAPAAAVENTPDMASITDSLSQTAYDTAMNVLKGIATSSLALVNVAAMLLIMPVVCFYLIRDYDKIVEKIDGLLPLRYRDTIREQMNAIDDTLAAYLRGQLQVMVILASYYAVGLAILGVPYALIIALVSGVLILIPYLGTWVSTALAVGVAYSHGGDASLTMALWVFGLYILGQILEGQILVPGLIGEHVGLHPLWVLFGLLAGGVLFGFIGVLLAVPLTAVIGVLIKFAVARYRSSMLYQD